MNSRSINAYEDEARFNRDLLELIADPTALGLDELFASGHTFLRDATSDALVAAPFAATLARLDLQEVFLSAKQLAQLLSLPALVDLQLHGGSSFDYPSLKYTYPTLGDAHLAVLLTDPNARRLRRLSLVDQEWEPHEQALRAALPNLLELRLY